MARILITSGPTREHLDPVRFLSNGSSGRMGCALAEAAIQLGHEVVIVSGPVAIEYPPQAKVIDVLSTEQMLAESRRVFGDCDGMIGVAAPCDYRPVHMSDKKIHKTGRPLVVELVETPDIMAELAAAKQSQWLVGFALDTEDAHFRALTKLQKKHCDLIVLNGPQAMHAADNEVEVLDPAGDVVLNAAGTKEEVAISLMQLIHTRLVP